MTGCPNPNCQAPRCKGYAWSAKSNAKPDREAFILDVRAHMALVGSKDAGKCSKAVYDKAMAAECVFS